MKSVNNIEELKILAYPKSIECRLLFEYGLYTRKTIHYNPKQKPFAWHIINHIDNTKDLYKSDEEFKKDQPKVFEAMNKGALIYDVDIEYTDLSNSGLMIKISRK